MNSVLDTTGLATLEGYVTRAERDGGGWLQIVFHYVCDRCNVYAVTMPNLSQFLSWLSRRTGHGTTEETVREVINTPFAPPPVRVSAGAGGALSVTAFELCPSTPIAARCVDETDRRAPQLRVARRRALLVTTSPAATHVSLTFPGGRPHGRPADRSLSVRRLRWLVDLPRALKAATCTLKVTYALGSADYRLRLALSAEPNATPRPS